MNLIAMREVGNLGAAIQALVSAVEFEKSVAGANILGIIIGKLCHGKKLCLIILLKVDKGSEIGFYFTILFLCLIVHLRLEGGGKFLLDA